MEEKRKVLVVGSARLFGSAVEGVLGSEGSGRIDVKSVRTVEEAIEVTPEFRPDAIVLCVGRESQGNEQGWQRLRSTEGCPARIVRCTLEHNHLTIYDTTRIPDATAEDLLAAVCDIGSGATSTNRQRGGT